MIMANLDMGNPDCARCGGPFFRHASDMSTGYGRRPSDGARICVACCGDTDRADMVRDGKIYLYLTKSDGEWAVTNWPGTLKFRPYYVTKYRHPFAHGAGHIAYFTGPDGKRWSARNASPNHEIALCRRLKCAAD